MTPRTSVGILRHTAAASRAARLAAHLGAAGNTAGDDSGKGDAKRAVGRYAGENGQLPVKVGIKGRQREPEQNGWSRLGDQVWGPTRGRVREDIEHGREAGL